MQIEYLDSSDTSASVRIDGEPVSYALPPIQGSQSECLFQVKTSKAGISAANGREIVAFVDGTLVHKQGVWKDRSKTLFPSKYIVFPQIITVMPRDKSLGKLEGGLFIDEVPEEIPGNIDDWNLSPEGVYFHGNRRFAPLGTWYKSEWNSDNGAVIGLCGSADAAKHLESIFSPGLRKPISKEGLFKGLIPMRTTALLRRFGDGRPHLVLDSLNGGNPAYGCMPVVFKQTA
ncbi:Uncharacterised protein [uncultured archaeon]|nr:Uncharacterised protein [uncultured archaeon]